MQVFGAVAFTLILMSPLAAAPGMGYDALRRPFVWALVALLLGRVAVSVAGRRQLTMRRDPLLVAALILLAANVISVAAAISAWEAAAPLLVLAAGVAVYAFARSGYLSRTYVLEWGLWGIAATGLAFAAVGLLQEAPVSTEGNPNYAGALSAILLPPAAAFTLMRAARWKRALSAIAALALLVLLWRTGSRGGFVGAAAGSLLMGAALLWKRVPRGWIVAGGLLVLLAAGFALQGRRQMSPERAESVTVRLELWKGAWRMFQDRPWLGVGIGHFSACYPPYRGELESRLSNKSPEADFREAEDPHSSWMQVLVETGVPGALAFLLVVYVALRLWRYYVKSSEDADFSTALAGLGGGAAAYLVAGLFNTLTLHASHTVLFWAFLGMIELVGNPRARIYQRPAGELAVAIPIAATIAAVFAAYAAGTLAWVDREFTQGMATADAEERVNRFQEVLKVHYPAWKMHYQVGVAYGKMGRLPDSAQAYEAALRFHPHHVPSLMNFALMKFQEGSGGKEAEERLRRAAKLAPAYYLSHYNLGVLEARRGRRAEARGHFERALALHPRHAASCFGLGEACLEAGDSAQALENFRRARELGLDVATALRREHPEAAKDPAYAEMFR